MKGVAVELRNINKIFGKEVVLDNINMSIQMGEMVAIVGESGAGKTTLLNIIGLISQSDSGECIINGKKYQKINSKGAMLLRRNYIGYLFQNYGLVDDETVEWNLLLAYAYKNVSKQEQKRQMKKLLDDFEMGDVLKKKIYQLSGGEQQRVAMMRLIIKDCSLILADEPTGSLDAKNRDIVLAKLKEMNRLGKTVLIVTHDSLVAKSCDRVINI